MEPLLILDEECVDAAVLAPYRISSVELASLCGKLSQRESDASSPRTGAEDRGWLCRNLLNCRRRFRARLMVAWSDRLDPELLRQSIFGRP